jgi:hypothetical protein
MQNYHLGEDGRFFIEDYQNCRPFASFLPGIAGLMGQPLWVFYVNRGQAITSFGVENKDKPILEYHAANRAYQLTTHFGFRTFFRMRSRNRTGFYEPFKTGSSSQKMVICANELCLQEINHENGLKTEVVYFLLPGENLAGLVRMVTVSNQSDYPIELELLDGLPAVIPFGVTNTILKEIGRTVEAWMEVYQLEKNVPYYHLRASVSDTTEVSSYEAGHFMLAFHDTGQESMTLPSIVDPALVFGHNTALDTPDLFYQQGLEKLLSQKQITCGRTPCGFLAFHGKLEPGKYLQVNSIYGHVSRWENLQSQIGRLTNTAYLDAKRREASEIVRSLTEVVSCQTGSDAFDAYSRQTFLDNILRGGWPITYGAGKKHKVYHVFSRKHGDLERDYNAFSLATEYFSQGNGSYRDVNQNRREDIWFNPAVEDFDIRLFMSLIQIDGYNPLIIQGSKFTIPADKLDGLLKLSDAPSELQKLLSGKFSPGSLLKDILDGGISLNVDLQQFLEAIMENSEQHIEASTGEGYWIDHWTYNLDLIDSYLSVFPEQKHELLFSNVDYPFYDSAVIVQSRSRKYVLWDGQPRQMNSLVEDPRKAKILSARRDDANWLRTKHGMGSIYRTSLFSKLFGLAMIKFATLDPWGMGIEMEAGRPGWDDALNGLPGLFGSSMAETYVLKRLVGFLRSALEGESLGHLSLPIEIARLLHRLIRELKWFSFTKSGDRDHHFWDHVSSAREAYRASVRLGLIGTEEEIPYTEIKAALDLFESKIEDGITRAIHLNNGLPPTYFSYRVEEYEYFYDRKGRQKRDAEGRPYIGIKKFSAIPLPLFLEGMVRMMRIAKPGSAELLYERVKESELFDRELRMYKINASLDEFPKDIGRVCAFTPGWLENESIWLHMEYKYLLEVLRSGLYRHFFEDFKTTLIPYLDPKEYGRSILENSSFLVSSVHPDESLHGAGFVARLSGASAEFLSMWRLMMAGERPFCIQDGQLCLALKPILPGWLFSEENLISFRFLGKTMVTYHNPERRDTFDPHAAICTIILHSFDGRTFELTGGLIPAPYAERVRSGQYKQLEVYFA